MAKARKKPARRKPAARNRAPGKRPVPQPKAGKVPKSRMSSMYTMLAAAVVIVVMASLILMFPSGVPQEGGQEGLTAAQVNEGILDRCQEECEGYGYLEGVCVWPTEVETPALELWGCVLEGTRHCGNEGQCKCFCQKLKETGEEFCVKEGTGYTMSLTEAKLVAQGGECLLDSSFTDVYYCNEFTGTWWIDLDLEKEGCNPACVIDVQTGDSEINWRCTGLVVP